MKNIIMVVLMAMVLTACNGRQIFSKETVDAIMGDLADRGNAEICKMKPEQREARFGELSLVFKQKIDPKLACPEPAALTEVPR